MLWYYVPKKILPAFESCFSQVVIASLIHWQDVWITIIHHCIAVSCAVANIFRVIFFFFFFFFWRQGLSMQPWLSWSSLCKPECPRIHIDPPISAFCVLGLNGCATKSSLEALELALRCCLDMGPSYPKGGTKLDILIAWTKKPISSRETHTLRS